MTWTQTHSGKRFDIFHPRTEDACIEDIAHALAHICRFNGHTKQFYSVAEHSLNCARIAATLTNMPYALLDVLIHDAAEAFIGDIPAPWKNRVHIVNDQRNVLTITNVEQRVNAAIRKLAWPTGPSMPLPDHEDLTKYCDKAMLFNEKALALEVTDIPWESTDSFDIRDNHILKRLDFYPCTEAAFNFLKLYEELQQCRLHGTPVTHLPLLSLAHLRT